MLGVEDDVPREARVAAFDRQNHQLLRLAIERERIVVERERGVVGLGLRHRRRVADSAGVRSRPDSPEQHVAADAEEGLVVRVHDEVAAVHRHAAVDLLHANVVEPVVADGSCAASGSRPCAPARPSVRRLVASRTRGCPTPDRAPGCARPARSARRRPTAPMRARARPPPPLVVDPLGPTTLPLQPPMPIAPMIQSSFLLMLPPGAARRRVRDSPRHGTPGRVRPRWSCRPDPWGIAPRCLRRI